MGQRKLRLKELVRLVRKEDWEKILDELPELQDLVGLYQGRKYHYTDAWTHTQHVVKAAKLLKNLLNPAKVRLNFEPHPESGFAQLVSRPPFVPEVARWIKSQMRGRIDGMSPWDILLAAALLHDIGKPETAEDVGDGLRVHFIGHENVGAEKLDAIGVEDAPEAWKLIVQMVKHHIKPILGFNYHNPKDKSVPLVPNDRRFRAMLLLLAVADITASKSADRFYQYRRYFNEIAWFWIYFDRLGWLVRQAVKEKSPLRRRKLAVEIRNLAMNVPKRQKLNDSTGRLRIGKRFRFFDWLWRKMALLMADPVETVRFEAALAVGLLSLKSFTFRNRLISSRPRSFQHRMVKMFFVTGKKLGLG